MQLEIFRASDHIHLGGDHPGGISLGVIPAHRIAHRFRLLVTRNDLVELNPSAEILYKCKKLQFIHKLTSSDTSKTAKITKR